MTLGKTHALFALLLAGFALALPQSIQHRRDDVDTQLAAKREFVVVYAPTDDGSDFYSMTLDRVDRGADRAHDNYIYSCWKPLNVKKADVPPYKWGASAYDMKPANVYGMSDCTYAYNTTGDGGGILNCPSGPKDFHCWGSEGQLDPAKNPADARFKKEQLAKHTCKSNKIVDAENKGICVWTA